LPKIEQSLKLKFLNNNLGVINASLWF
jgi:hypothetical protein